MDQLFFVQDSRGLVGDNLMFWAVGSNGYTSDLRQSARFSKTQAVALNSSRESDIPWPSDYLMARFYIAVDMQHLRHVDKNSRDVAFYRQIPGYHIGNDVVWETIDGQSTDLRKARIFTGMLAGAVMWPVEEIQKIARPAVRASDVSIKEALKETGVMLQQPKKIKRDVCKCHQCGRFLSEQQLWSGECPKCGADNRP
jgi:hypothetical protein